MLREDRNPASLILQRIQAEAAFRELDRKRARHSIAVHLRALWRARAFLVFLLATGFLLGVLIAILVPPQYTSVTRLMPPDTPVGSSLAVTAPSIAGSRGGGLGDFANDLLGLKNASELFVGILNSRTIQDQIIDQFDLRGAYGVRLKAEARAKLADHVEVSVGRKDQIITVSVTDCSPQRAQGIANAFVEQLNRLVSELSTSSARRERIFLESRLMQVNQDLQAAEKEFSQFASKNNTIDIKEQGRAMLEAAATVQGQLMVARSELQGLRQIYTDSSIRVRSLQARVSELQSQLEKFGGKDQDRTTLGPDSDAATIYPSIRKLPLLGATYADLFRRAKVQETVFEVLTQRYELAKVQEAREIPTVRVLDPAEIPEQRSFPPRLLLAGAFAMAVSFFLGAIFLLLSTTWRESDAHDFRRVVLREIWTDLKEKRFFTSEHDVFPLPNTGFESILSFLRKKKTHDNGATALSSERVSPDDSLQSDFSGSKAAGGEPRLQP